MWEGISVGERVQSYRDLFVWQRAMDLVESVYRLTRDWPNAEQFGLTSQVRRAAISIPSNIAEGQGRTGPREMLHYCSIAHGSLCEVETQLMIALRLAYGDVVAFNPVMEQAAEVGRLLQGLMRRLR